MSKSPTPPDPSKSKSLGAIPKLITHIPIKMDVEQASSKRKAAKSNDDSSTPPASPTATKRKVAVRGETPPRTNNDESCLVPLPIPLPEAASGGQNDSTMSENISASSVPHTRVRAYPSDFAGPFTVFFRSKGKKLNVLQITRDLKRLFSAVTLIEKVGNKVRVSVGNAKQANEIARSELFLREWNVYVPSRDVEVVGVVTEESLTASDLQQGVGVFKNSALPEVKILDCRQLSSVSLKDGKKIYSPSSSFRVTFEGSTLPKYVSIGCLRLPVRLFVPRVWTCQNCQQLGHSTSYCGNKARCTKCGEDHAADACQVSEQMCVYCKQSPHELSSCPVYRERTDKLKRSLKGRSRRSYAEMVKKTLPVENIFAPLSEDEGDEGEENGVGAQSGGIWRNPRASRRNRNAASLAFKDLTKTPTGSAGVSKPTRCCDFDNNNEFPALPRKQKMPGFSKSQSENPSSVAAKTQFSAASREQSGNVFQTQFSSSESQTPSAPGLPFANVSGTHSGGLIPFSELVESILLAFGASESTKALVRMFIPTVKTLLQQLTANWPILSMIVSFDG